jgi:hypothetical protein
MNNPIPRAGLAVLVLFTFAACADVPTAMVEGDTLLTSVIPEGGSTGVEVGTTVTIQFSHRMGAGMEAYAVLHEGDVSGPVVAGTWSWTADRTALTFTPAGALKRQTRYTLHLGGGMMDATGHAIGFGQHGSHMGGEWTGGGMMSGSGMIGRGGMMGGGMMGAGSTHTGSGWQHANGSPGMVFSFTTA